MESNSAQHSSHLGSRVAFRLTLAATSLFVLVAALDVGGFRGSFL
jgi:hypothetical protein